MFGRIVGTRIHRQTRPDAGKRHDVDQVAGADQRLAHVVPAVDWNRAEPGFIGVGGFDARVEAHVLADLEDQPRAFIGFGGAIAGDDDLRRGVAEADLAAFGFGNGVVGVSRHPERVLIFEGGAGARTDAFTEHRPRAFALLEPVAPAHAELADGSPEPQRNRADRIAVGKRQFRQKQRQLGVRERWKASQRDHADVPSADARFEARNEVLVAQHRVERHRMPRGAFTWHIRPLMQLVMCDSSADRSSGTSFHTGLIASTNSWSCCLNHSRSRSRSAPLGTPEMNAPPSLVSTADGRRQAMVNTHRVSK